MIFPNRTWKFVWRNWDLLPAHKIAQFLGANEKQVSEMAAEMGLPGYLSANDEHLDRNFSHVLRRNWDILPFDQLAGLIGQSEDDLRKRMREDDFLDDKLGKKPDCEQFVPDVWKNTVEKETAFIRSVLEDVLPRDPKVEERFGFVAELTDPHHGVQRDSDIIIAKDEFDLSEGWTIILPDSPDEIMTTAVDDFVSFVQECMCADISASSHNDTSSANKCLRLCISGNAGISPEGFRIASRSKDISLEASESLGLMRGLYCLEDRMTIRGAPFLSEFEVEKSPKFSPRIFFSYLVSYGSALSDPDGAYPDGYLSVLSHHGFNAVWVPAIFRDLSTSPHFPEFGEHAEERQANLNRLVERAQKFGIGVYLYLNEPRGMPEGFFDKHPDVRGARARVGDEYAMCTSHPEVRNFLRESAKTIFENVPGLRGAFTITASEQVTNCLSHSFDDEFSENRDRPPCQRCGERPDYEVVSDAIRLIHEGATAVNPDAHIIAWSWSWHYVLDEKSWSKLIATLPKGVSLMTDFERGAKKSVGESEILVDEYSLSVVGPSPMARRHAELARENEMPLMAKIQISTSSEFVTVPYLPVYGLVRDKFEALESTRVSGILASWSFGSYPGGPTKLAQFISFSALGNSKESVEDVARLCYGDRGAEDACAAWRIFSESFREYPCTQQFLYFGPIHHGPSHPLHFEATGEKATLFNPKDDLSTWCANISPLEVVQCLEKMADKWEGGLEHLEAATRLAPETRKGLAERELGVVRMCIIHFKSTAAQIKFLLCRAALEGNPPEARRSELVSEMREIVTAEKARAREEYRLCLTDSRISYEPAMQYFFRPLDLLEKIVQCEYQLGYKLSRECLLADKQERRK